MSDISPKEADALVKVLSLAENHQMWADPLSQSDLFKEFTDDHYTAIQTVREFLKRNDIVTMHAVLEREAARIAGNSTDGD
jgi:phosphoglycerate dehydrogenase-like enzyme